MTKSEFEKRLYEKVSDFIKYWNEQQMQKSENEFPNDLPEPEWWEQFDCWIDIELEADQ